MKTRVVDLCAAIIPECVGDELENETLLKIILALSQYKLKGDLEANNTNATITQDEFGWSKNFTHGVNMGKGLPYFTWVMSST